MKNGNVSKTTRLVTCVGLFALAALVLWGCASPIYPVVPPAEGQQSGVPVAVSAVAAKAAATQKAVPFTLTSANDGVWKVYGTAAGGEALTTVSAAFDAPNLILTAAESDLAAGDYWVTVTETGKTESPRLKLTVAAYTAPGQSAQPTVSQAAVAKDAATQQAVSFTLTSTNTGVWKVYNAATGGTALATVSATAGGSILTLTAAESDLAAGDYWVTVTETGKTESPRLKLTVTAYAAPGQSAQPTVSQAAVTKTAAAQKAVEFTLTSVNDGEWKVYGTAEGGEVLAAVSAAADGSILTLSASGNDLAAGSYWVTVTEADKAESPRLHLTVNAYEPPPPEQSSTPAADNAVKAKAAATQKAVEFALTSANDGAWKVYDAAEGGAALATVSAAFSAPNLTLTASGADLAAGDYWVTVTETGKTESGRLKLTVTAYTAPDQSAQPTVSQASVAKTAATQKTVSFTLTSANTGVWKVYNAAAGGTAMSTVSAAFSAPNLTLTASGSDLAAGSYWVTVTESGKTESPRLHLTVNAQEQSATPTAGNAVVAKSAATQKAVSFALTSANDGVWKVYDAATGGEALSTVSAVFSAPNLTLTASGDDLDEGSYWVTVTETGKTESGRLHLTVSAPEQSATPAASNAVTEKGAAKQKAVSFSLSSANNGVWQVYDTAEGGAALTAVSATFSAPNLTLTASGDDLAAGDYWVTVTENGKIESGRLQLTVTAYTAPGQSAQPTVSQAAVTKAAAIQQAVSFTLTSAVTGTWKVYGAAEGGEALSTPSVTVDGTVLTLTASGDNLAEGSYYVTVTEADKTESPRLHLNVEDPIFGAIKVSFTGAADETITLTGVESALSISANTALNVTVTETFDSYRWFKDGVPMEGATTNTITVYGQDFSKGMRTLAVQVKKGGVPYSKQITFTVTD